ncbi:hypothetical protein [Oleiagrimonas soli]|uniref:Uncharacterized protein n=1 Tax=Oleiagrimonas soli TaxID=1543381 RepID=A0A841KFT4_9GAMM|nr:hypothetical protein [Oleiagrimonas soli]MBB6184493.1 hypothetical protein [Oleiagrimonas soli]
MQKIRIECIMVGGPEHGRTLIVRQDAARPQRPAIVAMDGELCRCAALRRTRTGVTRCLLVHPHASGRQMRDMLAAYRAAPAVPHTRNQARGRQSNASPTLHMGMSS